MNVWILPRGHLARGLLTIAVSAALLLASTAIAMAAEVPSRAFSLAGSFEGSESPDGSLEGACGVAVDSFGDVYVADYYHDVVDVYGTFGLSHIYLTQLKLSAPDGPCGLAVDPAGRLYVEEYHGAVTRYTPSSYPPSGATRYGEATVIDPGPSTGIALDPTGGRLYVDDRTAISEYSANGAPAGRIELGPAANAYGVAVSAFPATEGDVYVGEAARGEVDIYGASGSAIGRFDGSGTPQHGFRSLADTTLAVDQTDGHLLVADDLEPGFEAPSAVVDEFDLEGICSGQLPHQLVDAEPLGIAVEEGGQVLVGSGNGPAAWVYSFASDEPTEAPAGFGPAAVTSGTSPASGAVAVGAAGAAGSTGSATLVIQRVRQRRHGASRRRHRRRRGKAGTARGGRGR